MSTSPDKVRIINEVKNLSPKETETLQVFVTGLLAGRTVKDYSPEGDYTSRPKKHLHKSIKHHARP